MTQALHACQCLWCHDLDLTTEKTGPGHVALRFGNGESTSVLLDGTPILDCIEARAGPSGYVVTYHRGPNNSVHYCLKCHRGLCLAITYGNVSVTTPEGTFK